SFSAHRTGSLALLTSTANGSGEAACARPVDTAQNAHAIATSIARSRPSPLFASKASPSTQGETKAGAGAEKSDILDRTGLGAGARVRLAASPRGAARKLLQGLAEARDGRVQLLE